MNDKQPIVRIIRPNLTADERAKREEEVKRCLWNFCVAIERKEQERLRNAQTDRL